MALLEEQALKKPAQESTNDKDSFSLTFREAEVFQLVSKGYSNNEIAQELFLSLATVKSHISSIFRKFSFTKRTQTVIYQHQKRSCL
jgi:NarL family two-component system response regulator LiaR